eukprot:1760685-Prymnesium_polylepis.1
MANLRLAAVRLLLLLHAATGFRCAVPRCRHAVHCALTGRPLACGVVCSLAERRPRASRAARQFVAERFGEAMVPASQAAPEQRRARIACALLERRLQLERYDLGALLARTPEVLDLTEEQLVPTLDFLVRYVGEERLSEFVRAQPQALLWQADGMSPVAQHLRAFGIADTAIRKAR